MHTIATKDSLCVGRRRRNLVMAKATAALVMAMVICATLPLAYSNSFVTSACKTTAEPELCVSSLAGLPGLPNLIPTQLLNVAVQAAIGIVQKTSTMAVGLSGRAAPGLEQIALQDCIDLLDDTADHLSVVLQHVLSLDFISNSFEASSVNTFLSGGVTNQDTCIESIDVTNGFVKSQLQTSVQQISQSISAALALFVTIINVADFKSASHNRRLLFDRHGDGDDLPPWLSAADRRLLQDSPGDIQADAVVAQDGSGDYTTISDAVNDAPEKSDQRYVIYVTAGVYYENVEIKKKKTNLMLIGAGMYSTIVTGDKSVVDGTTTYRSATFAVKGAGFIARDISFENKAGPYKHQAVALRVGSDLSVFYRCSFDGYQDTLYAHSLRQFYRECDIYGTVDFIFGNAAAVLQSCKIMARKPLDEQIITITAQGRKDPNENTGFSIHDCTVTAAPDYVPVPTYLGRPWKEYSRTVYMQSYLDDIIQPQGWVQWNSLGLGLNTLYYGEYMNYGPGAGLAGRINWSGYHILNTSEANTFTVAQIIEGDKWLPSTGIAYLSGLKV
uniref:Pectinesterase n=1 Tax=Cunninghamia lanceolata TaxID=28977 RepID=A0A6G9W3H6_CUNLA|nr:pectin methylesterase 23 [Cunninghamia lanceolata]